MPLQPGTSKKVFSKNVSELYHHGKQKRSMRQILAIAYAMKRKSKGGGK
jgi:hypothetical protein